MLIAGIVGEYKLPSLSHRLKLFEPLVLFGVAGELFADGGIFFFSSHLQTISDGENAALRRDAAKAMERASKAEANLAGALASAESAKAMAKGYESEIAASDARAKGAEARAAEANRIAEGD